MVSLFYWSFYTNYCGKKSRVAAKMAIRDRGNGHSDNQKWPKWRRKMSKWPPKRLKWPWKWLKWPRKWPKWPQLKVHTRYSDLVYECRGFQYQDVELDANDIYRHKGTPLHTDNRRNKSSEHQYITWHTSGTHTPKSVGIENLERNLKAQWIWQWKRCDPLEWFS